MNRRQFLRATVAAGGIGTVAPRLFGAKPADRPTRFLLSSDGCGRATGYAEANKIVTLGDRTHVAWLDSVPAGFRVRVRTLDRTGGGWSPTYTLGEAHDNHGGPALTADSHGYLHVVYYPHHHPFRYRKSRRPNDASEWEVEVQFGQRLTYPTLVCGADDTLYLTCRRSFPQEPWQVELWTKRPDGPWEGPRAIARARYPGYAHFQESLAWSPDQSRLHLCCRIHEKTDKEAYGRIQTVSYMVSDDLGSTWRGSDGSVIETPATAETIEVIASGGVDAGRILRAGAMGVGPDGTPHLIYSVTEDERGETVLAIPQGDGGWRRLGLSQHLPEPWQGWDLIMPGGLTFAGARPALTVTIQRVGAEDDAWGHPTSEVVELASPDRGKTFSFRLVSRPNEATSHWLPNVEKPTGHNVVPSRPGIIYTAGPPGEKNTDILSNGVYWFG